MQFPVKYFDILATQFKNTLARESIYRANFLTTVVVDLIWIGVEFSLFSVIYANVTTLADWSQHQVFFFLGVFFTSDALFTTFFQKNFWTFSDLVNHGQLDSLLTRPANPLFLALTRSFNLTAGFNFFMGIAIMIRFADKAGFPGGSHWLLLAYWICLGVFSAVLLRFFFSVWIFWTDRNWALHRLYFQGFQLASKPDALFPKTVRRFLRTILPFAFIGSVPATAVLFPFSALQYLEVIFVLICFCSLNLFLWKKGLKRYQSASS